MNVEVYQGQINKKYSTKQKGPRQRAFLFLGYNDLSFAVVRVSFMALHKRGRDSVGRVGAYRCFRANNLDPSAVCTGMRSRRYPGENRHAPPALEAMRAVCSSGRMGLSSSVIAISN
jgi:hypothetical protein